VQIATNSTFSPVLIDLSGIDSTFYIFNGAESNTTYYWRVRAQNNGAISGWSSEWRFATGIITGVKNSLPERLPRYVLHQNYPNPFNPETEIRFALPQVDHIVLKIFNIFGEEIRTLANEPHEAGSHAVRWDGNDERGNPVASGMYLYQLRAGNFAQVRKMNLLR
jgi:hypothetical protein